MEIASHPVKPLQNRSAVGIAVRCEPRKGGQQTHRLFLQSLVPKNTTQNRCSQTCSQIACTAFCGESHLFPDSQTKPRYTPSSRALRRVSVTSEINNIIFHPIRFGFAFFVFKEMIPPRDFKIIHDVMIVERHRHTAVGDTALMNLFDVAPLL